MPFFLSCPCSLPFGTVVKNPPANAGGTRDTGSIPGLGRSPEGGNGNPLWYSCLKNSMDRGTWQATVHGVTKSWTQLSNWAWELGNRFRDQKKQENLKAAILSFLGSSWEKTKRGIKSNPPKSKHVLGGRGVPPTSALLPTCVFPLLSKHTGHFF